MADVGTRTAREEETRPDAPYTGGCACGAVRYSITGKPAVGVECHCRQCQHDSGTGHASHLVFVAADAKVTGQLATWSMRADSGQVKTRGFCPTCGSAVTLTFADRPEFLSVRAGSLDDPNRYAPQVVTYAAVRPAWDRTDPALQSFPGMPPR